MKDKDKPFIDLTKTLDSGKNMWQVDVDGNPVPKIGFAVTKPAITEIITDHPVTHENPGDYFGGLTAKVESLFMNLVSIYPVMPSDLMHLYNAGYSMAEILSMAAGTYVGVKVPRQTRPGKVVS